MYCNTTNCVKTMICSVVSNYAKTMVCGVAINSLEITLLLRFEIGRSVVIIGPYSAHGNRLIVYHHIIVINMRL